MAAAFTPVPALPGHALLTFLAGAVTLLVVAVLAGAAARRVGLPAVVGELGAGVLAGPSVLGTVEPGWFGWLFPADPAQFHLLDGLGQVAGLIFVGTIGLHIDAALVKRRGLAAVLASVPGLILPLGLGIAIGFVLPAALVGPAANRTEFALLIGVLLSVSAIPVTAKILLDMNLIHRNIGQLILVAGMFGDAVAWLLLSVVTAISTHRLSAMAILTLVSYLAAFLTVGFLAVRRLVRAAARLTRDSSSATGLAGALILLFAAVAQALGFEAVFGAFVAGAVVGTSGIRDIRARLEPLRKVATSLLAPLFFALAGLRVDLATLARPQVLLAGVITLLVATVAKFAGAMLGGLACRMSRWEAAAFGAGLNARGVVEVVMGLAGLQLGVLSPAAYTIIIMVAIITSVMAPPVLRTAAARMETTEEERLRALWAAESAERDALPAEVVPEIHNMVDNLSHLHILDFNCKRPERSYYEPSRGSRLPRSHRARRRHQAAGDPAECSARADAGAHPRRIRHRVCRGLQLRARIRFG